MNISLRLKRLGTALSAIRDRPNREFGHYSIRPLTFIAIRNNLQSESVKNFLELLVFS